MQARSLPVRSPYVLDCSSVLKVSHGHAKNMPTAAFEEGTGNRHRKDGITTFCGQILRARGLLNANLTNCGPGGGMADTEDSKSFALTGVRVQIPPRAQKKAESAPRALQLCFPLACGHEWRPLRVLDR